MRVVGVFDHLAAPALAMGGAARTALAHLGALARERGHTCHVLTPALRAARAMRGGLPLRTYRDFDELKVLIAGLRPDVVISNLDLVYDAADLCHSAGVPHVALLDSFECCEPTASEKRRWGISLERRYLSADQVRFALRASECVLACSRALARRVRRQHAIRAEVLYPAIDPRLLPVDPRARPEFITGVCGARYKGAQIFLELARRFPAERFLLAGAVQEDVRAQCADLSNVTLSGMLSTRVLLRRSRIVLVPSQWQEPFGRIAVEAMASGIPVLASATGGLCEIVGATALAVHGFRRPLAWARALEHLLGSERARSDNARVGRRRARSFLSSSSARLERLIGGAAPRRPARTKSRSTIELIGGQRAKSAYAIINERLTAALQASGRYAVRTSANARAVGGGAADCSIHHDFSVEFSTLPAPAQGRWIAMRPWDFGSYPSAWVRKIRAECDQLWVPSRWSKALAVRSGIPSRSVTVIPWGIDPAVFTPGGRRMALATRKRLRFLFVGAPIYRKGLDIALAAYGDAFTAADDVCFMIKSNPDDLFYGGIGLLDRVTQLRARPNSPEVLVVDAFLSAARLAALYRACTVGVFPYRAEGFALPILEGMACGLPPIVPDFGACLDYCARGAAFRVPARRIQLPVRGNFAFNTLGFREDVDDVDFCEVPIDALAAEMRRVAALPARVLQRTAERAARLSRQRFTWAHTAGRVERALDTLMRRVPRRIAAGRRVRAHAAELLASGPGTGRVSGV